MRSRNATAKLRCCGLKACFHTMANNWGIPEWLEAEVRNRDKLCVYCRIPLKAHVQAKGTPGDKATFEHIDNDGLPTKDNIAMCCAACNSSKGVKKLQNWPGSDYCKIRNINHKTVADIIQGYIAKLWRVVALVVESSGTIY